MQYSVLKPGQEEADTILANPEDAFDVGACFSLVTYKNIAAHADDFKLVRHAVSVEEPRE